MRQSTRLPSRRIHDVPIRFRTSERQRLRVHDAARDHLSAHSADQALTVARRTATTWR
jgi:hypothetical protein